MKPKITVLFEHGWDNKPFSSAYIRLINPLSYPIIKENYEVSFCSDYYGNPCDIIIIDRLWRPDMSMAYGKSTIQDIHRRRLKLIYACDDNFLDRPIKKHGWFTQEKVDVVKLFLQSADQVWVTTEKLKERFIEYSQNILVIPNCLDERLINLNIPQKEKNDKEIRIGYMGTFTHINDLAIISEALNEIGSKYENQVSLQIIGIGQDNEINGLFHKIKVEKITPNLQTGVYTEFVPWFFKTVNWDIAISPLIDTPLNNSKSDIKFIDYSLIYAPGVYSDLTPYNTSKSIRDCYSGIIVPNNNDDWFYALDTLMWNSSLRTKIAENAFEILINSCTLKAGIYHWCDALETIDKNDHSK